MSIYDLIAQGGKVADVGGSIDAGLKTGQNIRSIFDRNAIQDVLNNGGMDPTTGQPTQQAMSRIMQINPEFGQKFAAGQQTLESSALKNDIEKWGQAGQWSKNLLGLQDEGQFQNAYQQMKPELERVMGRPLPPQGDRGFLTGLAQFSDAKQRAAYQFENGYVFDPNTGQAVKVPGFEDSSKLYSVDGALVTPEGNVVYQGSPKQKPMPASAAGIEQQNLQELALASGIKSNMEKFTKQIDEGKLNLGLMTNLYNKALNKVNLSTEESSNLASFQASLSKLRNDSLRLNKGTQTEGDAVRAWDELINSLNDQQVVKDRLAEISLMNESAAKVKKLQNDQLRAEYGKEPLDYSPYEQAAAIQSNDLSKHEGKIIQQDGKRYKITNGQPVEVQ